MLSSELCLTCGQGARPMDYVAYGLWPVSLANHVFLSYEAMNLINTLTNFNPLVSYTTVSNSLNFISKTMKLVC